MRTLICGSIAYDTIMVFRDRFKNHILPDQLHILNVAFLVPDLRREFGGCAGNIAYNLKHAGRRAAHHGDRRRRLPAVRRAAEEARSSRSSTCAQVPGTFTAQAFITTDLDDNQITAFHPGRDEPLAREPRAATRQGVKLGIVAPDGRDGMLQHAREFHAAGIPFVFDPGQGLPMFNGAELLEFVQPGELRDGQRLRRADAAGAHRQEARGAGEDR